MSLEQNTAQTSSYRKSHRYAIDRPLIRECVTELLKTVCISSADGVPVKPRILPEYPVVVAITEGLCRIMTVEPWVSRFVPVFPRCCPFLDIPPSSPRLY